ncbi:ATP-grasp domain-containing protein [Buttiauxella ferragutiae]|uniref:ATP-grasp domain-containing protein n=1 Tax=Buttiauxella ferragutiae TaxID=82989 RepID=UPI001F53631F|nr:ATP-grasp domain-containing protein [Buttiauxella ferragutiae]UNK59944.1 ATP-grasp domain-containing protein [Buttiauxella ferragutiae]
MSNKIWLMEGLSSQRDIIQGMKSFAGKMRTDITVYASHRNERNEILSVADFSLAEPKDAEMRLPFILSTVAEWDINAIHTGRNCLWFENHRKEIEESGVSLTTGASGPQWLEMADDKVTFAQVMEENHLPAVPSLRINSIEELQHSLSHSPFEGQQLCVKPVTGIYGMGFWRFDDNASSMDVFNYPEKRIVHPGQYIEALAGTPAFTSLVLMPYLPGPEYSVDILADKGEVLAAVARRKEGALQHLENSGEAFELACACARAMKVDGLVNVQTRNNNSGRPVLLETNMRPSGGIGYTQHSGVNLPGLFAFHKLGLMSKTEVIEMAKNDFVPATVRSVTDVIGYSTHLTNRLN